MSVPVELFVSYSHKDDVLRTELMKFLKPLEREGVVRCWFDGIIEAGGALAQEISQHLNTADLILLLVSADFIASDYCYSIEMKQAVARHAAGEARVIPVILRHVDWHGAPFGDLKAVPRDGRPISAWQDADEALLDVFREIRRAIESLAKRKTHRSESISQAQDVAKRVDQHRSAPTFEGEWVVESCDSEDGNPAPGTKATLKRHQGQYVLRVLDTSYEWKLDGSGQTLLGGGPAANSVVSIILMLSDDGGSIRFSVNGPNISKLGVLRKVPASDPERERTNTL